MSRRDVPLRRCFENCSDDSAGHDGTEDNRSETAVDAQECCNGQFRQLYREASHRRSQFIS